MELKILLLCVLGCANVIKHIFNVVFFYRFMIIIRKWISHWSFLTSNSEWINGNLHCSESFTLYTSTPDILNLSVTPGIILISESKEIFFIFPPVWDRKSSLTNFNKNLGCPYRFFQQCFSKNLGIFHRSLT